MGFPTVTRSDLSTRMAAMTGRRRSAAILVGTIVVIALALPALAADPSADPSATASVAPVAAPPKASPSASTEATEDDAGGKPDKANKGNKADKTPEVAITLRGAVAMTTNADGFPSFTMSSGGKTYELEAGPPWFWGAKNPLAKFAGKTVTITGETSAGSTEVDVQAVDGTAIREPGKPPWAGGWKAVGSKHPGWSQEKADRFKAKFGDCFPPGQCKKADTAPAASPAIPRGD
jgi:hypothetical protein